MPLPAAAEERDRTAFQDLSLSSRGPREAGLRAHDLVTLALGAIAAASPAGEDALPAEWRSRAQKVLDRVLDRLGADLRRDTAQAMAGVYVIVDPEHTERRPIAQVVAAALAGGASAIQLRDKRSEKGALLKTATEVARLCKQAGAVFIVNDYADIARLCGADGLHVGQKDLPVNEARRVLEPRQITGKSNALLREALDAEAEGADYVAVGAMFETNTKADTRPAGIETLRQVKKAVAVPVVAIGGINPSNVAQVAHAGADAVCVATAVTKASDPQSACRQLRELFDQAKQQ